MEEEILRRLKKGLSPMVISNLLDVSVSVVRKIKNDNGLNEKSKFGTLPWLKKGFKS